MEPKTYVSERIVNIKELEDYIEKSHLSILSLIKGIEDGVVTDVTEVKNLLLKIDAKLKKAYTFEFCIERHTTIDKQV